MSAKGSRFFFAVAISLALVLPLTQAHAAERTHVVDPSASITLISSNGGEILYNGDVQSITWESSPDVELVYILIWYEYTCSGCPSGWNVETYEQFQAPNFGTSGSFDWNVFIPNPDNKHFKISVEGFRRENGIEVSLGRDFSDDPFTVLGTNLSEPICIALNAEVGYVNDPGEYLGSAIVKGDVITGTYIYDLYTPDINSSPTVGDFQHNTAPFGIALNSGGLDFRTDPNDVDFLVEIVNDQGNPIRDNYVIHSYNNIFDISVPSGSNNMISWQLDDPSATALSSEVLPAFPPVLADWQSLVGLTIESRDIFGNESFFIRAHVNSANLCNQLPTPQPTNTLIPTFTSTSTPHPSNNINLFDPYVNYPVGSGYATGLGDFNNDGLTDVVMTTSTQLLVFLQGPDGTLTSPVAYAAGSRPESLAVGDLNKDGRTDVVITNQSSNTISVFLQQPGGTLSARITYPTSSGPDSVAVGDVNGDGFDDVAVSHWNAPSIGIFTQNASGALNTMVAYSAPQAGYDDIAIGDVNGDGRNDVVKMNGQLYANPNLSVYTQNADGTLASATSYSLGCNCLSSGLGIGDVTGDGLADVVISYGGNRPSSYIAVFAQANNGILQSPISYSAYDVPGAVEVADVNSDGLKDVLVLNDGWNSLSVYLQGNHGALEPYSRYPIPYNSWYKPQGLAVGDINHDGYPDVTIADANNGLVILYHSNPLTPTVAPSSTATPSPLPSLTPGPGPDPWITVTSPNGGEELTNGEVYRITWQSSTGIPEALIRISYRCSGCFPWITLENFYPVENTGFYDWTVSVDDPTNKEFIVYIAGTGDTGLIFAEDFSDDTFTVAYDVIPTEPIITLPTPIATTTQTPTLTPTPTDTATPTPTIIPTETVTRTPSITKTASLTRTPSMTRTATPTRTASMTRTATPTRTPSMTRTVTPTRTPSMTKTATPTRTPSMTKTATPTRTPSMTKTVTPTRTPSMTRTATPTRTPSMTKTATPTRTASLTRTASPTRTPTSTKTRTPTKSLSPTPSTNICIAINANVEEVDDTGNYLNGAIGGGDVITGTYIYDSTVPDTNDFPTVGDYISSTSPFGITLSAGGLVFRTDPNNVDFWVEVNNNHGNPASENYLIRSSYNIFDVPVPSETYNEIVWLLDDPTLTALSSDALPTVPPVLSDWDSISGLTLFSQGDTTAEYYFIRAHVTSATLCGDIPTETPTPTRTPSNTPAPGRFLVLIDPNGGERIEYQSVYWIDWISQGVDKVQIHLLYKYNCAGCLGEWFSTPITPLIENTGQYDWEVLVDFPASDKEYKIRIDGFDIHGNPIGTWDDSNAPFYIFVPY